MVLSDAGVGSTADRSTVFVHVENSMGVIDEGNGGPSDWLALRGIDGRGVLADSLFDNYCHLLQAVRPQHFLNDVMLALMSKLLCTLTDKLKSIAICIPLFQLSAIEFVHKLNQNQHQTLYFIAFYSQ